MAGPRTCRNDANTGSQAARDSCTTSSISPLRMGRTCGAMLNRSAVSLNYVHGSNCKVQGSGGAGRWTASSRSRPVQQPTALLRSYPHQRMSEAATAEQQARQAHLQETVAAGQAVLSARLGRAVRL